MKIGIITYWDSQDNYGQLLQCFALQHFLRQNGNDAFLIRYKDERKSENSGFKLSKLRDYISNFKAYFNYFLQLRSEKKYASVSNNELRDFDGFRNTYLKMTDKVYDRQAISDDIPKADCYICGSDQIWGGSDIYYLSFVPDGKKRIAYAPSLGGVNPFEHADAEYIKNLLRKFSFIGMREASGVRLLNDNGFPNAVQVVDPTLLLNVSDYEKIAEASEHPRDAFVYLLGSPITCKTDKIFQFIEKKGWSYRYVASQGRADDYEKSALTIPAWISSIARSKIVITNSFHCIVFSLIFHKPFIFVPLADSYARMNDRLYDILGKSNLISQIYTEDFDSLPLSVDFTAFDIYHDAERKRSEEILNALL